MKVLYILHSTVMDGATISFFNLIEGLIRKGYEVVVIFPDWNEGVVERLKKLNVQYYKCPVIMSVLPANIKKASARYRISVCKSLVLNKYNSFKQIKALIRKENPNIIHTNVGVVHEGFWCSVFLRVPHIWHLREYQNKDFNWLVFPSRFFFKLLLRRSNVISITKDIHFSFGLKEDIKHRVIYNGILPESKTSLIFPKKKYFICCSRVSREKGHVDVITAFAKFLKQRDDYKLIILGFGDSSYINSLKELSIQLGCSSSVCFEGYKEDVLPYMVSATALIVASYYEGFGRMTAEAAFSGCFVIGRNTGGTKEILDEIGGFKFITNDQLVDCMNEACRLAEANCMDTLVGAQKRAVELYSNENNVNSILSFYKQIVYGNKTIYETSVV